MTDDASKLNSGGGDGFGSCCNLLQEAMSGQDFEPLIGVGEDGILYMSVGLIELEDQQPGMVDHPVFHCPFCGSQVQTPDEVREKAGDDDEEEATA